MNLQILSSLGWNEFPILIFALLLALVFFLVIRQNQKDFLEIEAWVAQEETEF
jgi:preprotein translocase subunit YajC